MAFFFFFPGKTPSLSVPPCEDCALYRRAGQGPKLSRVGEAALGSGFARGTKPRVRMLCKTAPGLRDLRHQETIRSGGFPPPGIGAAERGSRSAQAPLCSGTAVLPELGLCVEPALVLRLQETRSVHPRGGIFISYNSKSLPQQLSKSFVFKGPF